MTLSAQHIIDSFERLPESEKRKVTCEILRRSVQFEFPPLSDEEFVAAAEDLFAALDDGEAEDGPPEPGRGLAG
ncbi:MAG: hypothetical protein P4L55_05705 [Syntrophobacteraceae bacterium]|nr:hypothetical protein [Syntrophobacteraceae bacterium]